MKAIKILVLALIKASVLTLILVSNLIPTRTKLQRAIFGYAHHLDDII